MNNLFWKDHWGGRIEGKVGQLQGWHRLWGGEGSLNQGLASTPYSIWPCD